MLRLHRIPVFLVLLAAIPGSRAGPVVYTWVDDRGITCFSDTLPADESISVKLIEALPQPAARLPVDEDFYSVVNQAKRMETRRLLSEKLTAERLQAEAEASRARAEALAAQQPTIVYENEPAGYIYPYYPRHPKRHHKKHPHRDHEPEHYGLSSLIKRPSLSAALRLPPAIPESHRVHPY